MMVTIMVTMVMIIMMLVIDGDRIELNKMVVMTVDQDN